MLGRSVLRIKRHCRRAILHAVEHMGFHAQLHGFVERAADQMGSFDGSFIAQTGMGNPAFSKSATVMDQHQGAPSVIAQVGKGIHIWIHVTIGPSVIEEVEIFYAAESFSFPEQWKNKVLVASLQIGIQGSSHLPGRTPCRTSFEALQLSVPDHGEVGQVAVRVMTQR